MTPRPLYKWKSFWFGILVLGFLGWAWVRTENHVAQVIWVPKNSHQGFLIEQYGATVSFWHGEDLGAQEPGFSLRFYELEEKNGHEWFPEAFALETNRRDSGVTIAQWLVILLFLVPWVGFLAWRVRRQRKHTA